MAFTQVAVTGTFETSDGAPARGRVRFTPSAAMTNGGVTVAAAPVTATLNSGGELTVSLAANTDSGTTPTATTYRVEELLVGQRHRSYRIMLGHFDLTQNLVDIVAVGYPLPAGWGLMSDIFTETF